MATKSKTSAGLPEMAYTNVEGEKVLCIIKKGEKGYYRTDYKLKKSMKPEEFAADMNKRLKVTPLQAEAMVTGSMCGWQVPGANPAWLAKQAKKRLAQRKS